LYYHSSSFLSPRQHYYPYSFPRLISVYPYLYPYSSSYPRLFARQSYNSNLREVNSAHLGRIAPYISCVPVGWDGRRSTIMNGNSLVTLKSRCGPFNQIVNTSRISPDTSLGLFRLAITKNQERIVNLRIAARFNDAEALALMFEDREIADDGTLRGRLIAILDATESKIIPGLQTGIEFQDVGFRGDRNHGGKGFKDPHPSSRNQVGHFLTAVGLAFRPETVSRTLFGIRMRDHIGIPTSLSDHDVALRLTIGHELSPDPNVLLAGILGLGIPIPGSGPLPSIGASVYYEIWSSYRNQFFSVKPEDVAAFNIALQALGTNILLNMNAAEVALTPIFAKIRPQERGNSFQDLRLSLVGWYLGKAILQGRFTSGVQVSEWVRKNLKE
jgi:hypothetical protein